MSPNRPFLESLYCRRYGQLWAATAMKLALTKPQWDINGGRWTEKATVACSLCCVFSEKAAEPRNARKRYAFSFDVQRCPPKQIPLRSKPVCVMRRESLGERESFLLKITRFFVLTIYVSNCYFVTSFLNSSITFHSFW